MCVCACAHICVCVCAHVVCCIFLVKAWALNKTNRSVYELFPSNVIRAQMLDLQNFMLITAIIMIIIIIIIICVYVCIHVSVCVCVCVHPSVLSSPVPGHKQYKKQLKSSWSNYYLSQIVFFSSIFVIIIN